METAGHLESAIDLTWRQKIAAFWSIAWPCWLATFVLLGFITERFPVDDLVGHISALSVAANVAFLSGQAVLIQRLFRKQYETKV
jgi:hypothetical protein